MKEKIIGNPGNPFDKFHSKNPILKKIMNKFKKDVLHSVRLANPTNILEIGCGEGYITDFIRKNYKAKITGADLSEEIVNRAKKLYPDIEFKIMSIYDLKYKDNSYDLVISSEVLEHLEEPEKAIREIKRVAKKYCLITVPNEPFFTLANMSQLKHLKNFGFNPDHIQLWTRSGFRKLLKPHFSSIRIRTSTLWNIALCRI